MEVDDALMKKLHLHTVLIHNKIMKHISACETEVSLNTHKLRYTNTTKMGLVNGSEMKNYSLVVDFLAQPALMDEKDVSTYLQWTHINPCAVQSIQKTMQKPAEEETLNKESCMLCILSL